MVRKLRSLVAVAFATLLAVALLPSAAFALDAKGGSLTVSNLNEGDTVNLYQVASVTVNADNTLNKTWIIVPTSGKTVDDYEKADETGRKSIANDLAAKVFSTSATAVATQKVTGTTSATFSNLDPGLYYASVSNADDVSRVYANTLIPINLKANDDGTWGYDTALIVPLKDSNVSILKGAATHENGAHETQTQTGVSTNGTVFYKIDVVVPNYNGAANRDFLVKDKLPDGIEYIAGTMKVNGTATDPVVSTGGNISVDLASYLASSAGQTVSITYQAKLTGTAPIENGRTNTATLLFSANSYDATQKTVSDSVTVANAGIKIHKTAEDGKTALQGAEFQLLDKDGTTVLDTQTTDKDGNLTFAYALGSGTYTLKETKAPAGYSLVENQSVSVEARDNAYKTVDIIDPKDQAAGLLPTTGGVGTIAMTVLGVAVIAGTAALIVRGRKQD